jgi:hypothetical protein
MTNLFRPSNGKAHVAANNVLRNSTRLLLDMTTMDEANTDPPPCAALLLEAILKPAHVLTTAPELYTYIYI